MLRSHGGPGDATIEIETPAENIRGTIHFWRYKSGDSATTVAMKKHGNKLVGPSFLTSLPPVSWPMRCF
ncbi:MAG: hypothetical protein U5L09_02145 [Bacteroidales bacterium]|nr:hypothetical protein [Bacteroidales bacterium]